MKIALLCLSCTLVHIPSIILRYVPFREIITKKQKKVLFYVYATALVLNAVIYYFMYSSGNISIGFYKCNLLFSCVILAAVNSIVIRNRVREHFFTFGLTAIVISLLTAVTAFAEARLAIEDAAWQLTLNSGILCVVFAVLYPLLIKLMRNTITPFLSVDSRNYWKNIWFIPVAMFFASLLSFPLSEHTETLLQLVSRLMTGLATLFMCRSISYDYEQMKKREELNNALNRQKEYYTALSQKVDDARRARHDFKHHVTAVTALLEKKDYNAISEYIGELAHSSVTEPFIPFTGNDSADGVIYHYVLQCEKEHIRFDVRGMLRSINVGDMDLCVLLGNALDNAFAACLRIPDNRFIQLSFLHENGVLTITVQNSFDGIVKEKEGLILSRRRTDSMGIGISSMKSICEKHGGNLMIRYQNNCFTLMILLNADGKDTNGHS